MEVKIDPSKIKIESSKPPMVSQDMAIKSTLSKIKKKIAVMSGKGGVGKTTVSVNLAVALAQSGLKVGILDADITGPNIPLMIGLEGEAVTVKDQKIIPGEKYGVKVVSMELLVNARTPLIWRGPLKVAAIKQFLSDVYWGDLDVLVIDLPPGTSDEPLSIIQIIPEIAGAVVVATPQEVALLDVKKAVEFAKRTNMPILGVIENMSSIACPHCGTEIDIFGKGGAKHLAEELGIPFLGDLPLDVEARKMGDQGKPPVTVQDSPFGAAFQPIVQKLRQQIGL